MAKRIADKELTDRNWDQEEEGEEAGMFSIASDDVMKSRAIKKAKRRNTGADGETSGAFKGFKGFALSTAAPAAASTPTAFSGFGNGAGFSLTNGNSGAPFSGFSSPAATNTAPGLTFNGPSSFNDIKLKSTNGSSPSILSPSLSSSPFPTINSSNKEYSRQLTALNCSVRDWINKHVNDNPLCDLNPIFKDYEKHLASIEKQYGAVSSAATAADEKKTASTIPTTTATMLPSLSTSPPAQKNTPTTTGLFSFGKKNTTEEEEETAGKDEKKMAAATSVSSSTAAVGVSFNFGQKVDSDVIGSLGSSSKPAAGIPSFSFAPVSGGMQNSLFGSGGGTTFGGVAKPSATPSQPTDENGEEESDEPPKVEIKEVKEDDAFYSKKCKLFYKKDSEFKEKGVGTLHLKETDDGKTQMIIRADTNLGNILLNIMVHSSMPFSRVGKNNVMVVCVPNPPIDGKNSTQPVPLLIRVKTSEDADTLHKTLEEKKA